MAMQCWMTRPMTLASPPIQTQAPMETKTPTADPATVIKTPTANPHPMTVQPIATKTRMVDPRMVDLQMVDLRMADLRMADLQMVDLQTVGHRMTAHRGTMAEGHPMMPMKDRRMNQETTTGDHPTTENPSARISTPLVPRTSEMPQARASRPAQRTT